MVFEELEKISIIAGYHSFIHMFFLFVIPVLSFFVFAGLVIIRFVDSFPNYFGYMLMLLGLIIVFAYPSAKYGIKKKDINQHLHFFITYAGTISTMNISRAMIFKRIAQKKVFGELSTIFGRIHYLAKKWNFGFAHACRSMAAKSPSQILADFLDRMAVIMDFGHDLKDFLYDEQKAIIDDFAVEYQKSLETIRLLQEMFISLSISFSFVLGIALLAPVLMDISLESVMQYALIGIITVDFILVFAIQAFIPSDSLISELKKKNDAQKRIQLWFFITAAVSAVIFLILWWGFGLAFIFAFAIGILPLFYPAVLAMQLEEVVRRRDRQFPVYMRVLGSAIEVRNGGTISALKATQIHDFGVLNILSINLHRRLRLGCDKFQSWFHFAVESGSNLIFNFSKIFSESVYLGGNAAKIGEIVSSNMHELLSMRKLRWQLSQSLRGAFYGSLIGLVATMYVTARISQMLLSLFAKPQGLENQVFSFINAIIPQAQTINFDSVLAMIALMIVFHAAITSLIMKLIDGGSWYAGLFDFIIMVWIGAGLSWILPRLVGNFLPSFTGIWGG